jgi:hypothetical protein
MDNDNPLTAGEVKKIVRESRLHSSMGLTPSKQKYYQGMAEGMKDIAEEFSDNPDTNCAMCHRILPKGKKIFCCDRCMDRFIRETEQRRIKEKFKPNPSPEIVGKIYSRVIEIRACKAGIPHKCDSICRNSGHRFKHPFKQKACIYALSDGSLLIR